MAPDSIRPGEKWAEAINRGLEESGLFVLLLSPAAVASQWVKTETNIAIELNHEGEMGVYSILLQACRVPALWRAYQHVSLRGGYAPGLNKLLAVLEPTDPAVGAGLVSTQPAPAQSEPVQSILAQPIPAPQPTDVNPDRWIHPKSGLEMVRVPAGEFLYGDEMERVYLEEFWIAKTPVTNAAYKRFLDANPSYAVPYYDADWAKPYNWDKQHRIYPEGKADHPVVLVSWHDAQAYAQWTGMELLTEQQLEKAARGIDGRVYPWGNEWQNDHCNTGESGIGATTPVGRYSPWGDSPYGCVDMASNVWEWTQSLYKEGEDRRGLRGGSWNSFAEVARAPYRNSGVSAFVFNGFRVVVRPHSHHNH